MSAQGDPYVWGIINHRWKTGRLKWQLGFIGLMSLICVVWAIADWGSFSQIAFGPSTCTIRSC